MSPHSVYTQDQAMRYRTGALEARALASPCQDAELRAAYLSIARNWTELADKIERHLHASTAPRPDRRPA